MKVRFLILMIVAAVLLLTGCSQNMQVDNSGERLEDSPKPVADPNAAPFARKGAEGKPDIPPLGGARRRAVLNELARYPFTVPAERVVVGRPIANGLRGEEAEIISTNRLNFTRLGGPVPEPQQRTDTGTLRYLIGTAGGGAAPAGTAQPGGGPP